MTGLNRPFVLTLIAFGLALPACSTRGTPRPIPARAKVRIPSSGIEPVSLVPRYNDPLTESQRLEQSGAVRRIDGRLPVGPHVSAAFMSRAAAHQCERYVHPLTARANGRRNLPIHTAPVAPAPEMGAAFSPAPASTRPPPPAVASAAPQTPVALRTGHPTPTPRSSGTVSESWTRPVAAAPARSAPPAYVRPAAPSLSSPVLPVASSTAGRVVASTPAAPVAPPFSLSSVPAHLRDLPALQAQEERLADQSIAISMERRAVLRVAKAIREHQRTNTPEARERLDAAYSEYQQGATASRGLSLSSGAQAFSSAEPRVRDRLDAVNNERKAVTRLIVALRLYQQDPSASNGANLTSAVEKYNQR